jgi:hypothetical protein
MNQLDSLSLFHKMLANSSVQCGCCDRILSIWYIGPGCRFIPRHKPPKKIDLPVNVRELSYCISQSLLNTDYYLMGVPIELKGEILFIVISLLDPDLQELKYRKAYTRLELSHSCLPPNELIVQDLKEALNKPIL